MVRKTSILAAGASLALLAACAQEPVLMGISPTYDKFGGASCPGGYTLVDDQCRPIPRGDTPRDGYQPGGNGDDDDGGGDDGRDDPTGGGNQNRNTNQNTATTQTQTQANQT